MTNREIYAAKKQCERALSHHRFGECLQLCRLMLADAYEQDFAVQLDGIEDIYFNIIRFSVQGYDDPERSKIFNDTARKTIALVNALSDHILTHRGDNFTYSKKQELQGQLDFNEEAQQDFINELVRYTRELTEESGDALQNKQGVSYEIQRLIQQAFYTFWLKENYSENDRKFIVALAKNEGIQWQRRGQLISAVLLSLLRAWDPVKVHTLFDIYETGIAQLKERALFTMIVGLYWYDGLLKFYPDIEMRLDGYKNDRDLVRHIEAIMIQNIKAKETEEISRKWEEEVIPEMQRLKPKLEDKLSLDEIMSEEQQEDKNPDWENFFEDTPDLFDKLQEFTKLQMEGSDVLMSAFSKLKHFDFFREISNWFLPFDKMQYHVVQSLLGESLDMMPFLESLEYSFHMCNSDKYSFSFNLQFVPESQKKMMARIFNEEVSQMRELEASEEKTDDFAKTKTIYTQYLQDLYRFFKLYTNHSEFRDIFTFKFDLYNTRFFRLVVEGQNIERNIAEFHFEKGNYNEAVEIFMQLEGKEYNEQEIYEKIAYSYQKLKKFEQALEYYKKADLFDRNKKWLTKKMAFCNRKLGNYQKALEYYHKAEHIQPENLYIQTQLGHTYLQLGDYETALQHYFKVEFKQPDNIKIMRPIAWCSFMMGKMDNAEKYNRRIVEQGDATMYDYINMGHLQWVMGKNQEALNYYKKAVDKQDIKFKTFREVFEPDIPILEQHNISRLDINLMLDYLYYHYRGNELV